MQGSIPSWDHFLRDLVRQSGAAVLSVDYKLSPEYRFPVALDEMVTMTRLGARGQRVRHRSRSAGDRRQLRRRQFGAGDDAGILRAAGEQPISFQLLIYGVYSTDTKSPSWQQFGQGAGLSQTQMRWIWETYAKSPDQLTDWRLAPLDADLAGLPPAFLIVGSLDPLLDDSHKLAAGLKAAGVKCELTVSWASTALSATAADPARRRHRRLHSRIRPLVQKPSAARPRVAVSNECAPIRRGLVLRRRAPRPGCAARRAR